MPEIINTLFGRSKNATSSGEEAQPTVIVTVEPTGDATPIENVAEGVETAPSADDVVESTEDETTTDDAPADSDSENSDAAAESADVDDQADDDEPIADDAAIETDAEEIEQPATDEEAATDEDITEDAAAEVSDEDAENVEPVAAEADDAPVAAETAAADDADAEDAEEPVIVPVVVPAAAEARPAAGARGSVTVGEGVVAKVVNIVVGKVDGVHSIDDEGISVELDDDTATVKVSLVVEYGHAIKALAEQIRIDVIEAVEQFLGLDVAAVDVHVSDIHAA